MTEQDYEAFVADALADHQAIVLTSPESVREIVKEHGPDMGWRNGGNYLSCQACGCSCHDRWDDGPEWPCDVVKVLLALTVEPGAKAE